MLRLIAFTALVAFAAALALLALAPQNAPLAAHLALALGALPLILAAIGHFVPVLTRTRVAPVAVRAAPLAALAGGALAALGFAVPAVRAAAHMLAALLAALAGALLLGWLVRRAHRALGGAHPGIAWYGAALACLLLALAAVPAMAYFPEQYGALRRLHLHLNTLGFVALTAVGTLQVLLPTVAGRPDAHAARRLRHGVGPALAGALLIAFGAAWLPALAWLGGLAWLAVLAQLAVAWLRGFRGALFAWHRPGAALGAALLGLFAMLVAGALHAARLLPAATSVPAFFFLFLLPLVTGALSHLLPLWFAPRAAADAHARMRQSLARHSALRALLFLAAGLGTLAGVHAALLAGFAGLASFALQLLRTARG